MKNLSKKEKNSIRSRANWQEYGDNLANSFLIRKIKTNISEIKLDETIITKQMDILDKLAEFYGELHKGKNRNRRRNTLRSKEINNQGNGFT